MNRYLAALLVASALFAAPWIASAQDRIPTATVILAQPESIAVPERSTKHPRAHVGQRHAKAHDGKAAAANANAAPAKQVSSPNSGSEAATAPANSNSALDAPKPEAASMIASSKRATASNPEFEASKPQPSSRVQTATAKPTATVNSEAGAPKSERESKPEASSSTATLADKDFDPPPPKMHRVVIQVTQNDPSIMTTALNNAENLSSYYRQRGEDVQIEFVAYGPGLHMLRTDTSPVSERIKRMSESNKRVAFSACGNTQQAQSKQENKEVTLLPEARVVPAGIARITELQEQGWTYVRP